MSGLHVASGNWKRGLALALTTTVFWATLPIALKRVLDVLDVYTITWFRFLFAAVLTALWLWSRGQLGQFRGLSRRHAGLLVIAALGLIGNYVFYLLGLNYTSPANAQLLIQMAPLFFAIGGVLVFREKLHWLQIAGFVAIVAGLALFYFEQQGRAEAGNHYGLGALMMLIGALTWAGYALAQKQLLLKLSSQGILLVIYIAAAVLLAPFATPSTLLELDTLHSMALLYCAFNTVIAYGAFAAALAYWEASRVGAVLATTPMMTVLAVIMMGLIAPGFIPAENLGVIAVVGALVVVAGSMLVSFGRAKVSV